jgi:hypothetical protein
LLGARLVEFDAVTRFERLPDRFVIAKLSENDQSRYASLCKTLAALKVEHASVVGEEARGQV